jgi:phospholipid:diacylglycerol acyltransferase
MVYVDVSAKAPTSRYTRGGYEHSEGLTDGLEQECREPSTRGCEITRSNPLNFPLLRKSWIDAEYSNGEGNPKVN